MSELGCVRSRIERNEAPGLLVRDVMDAAPKTAPPRLTVGELRAGLVCMDATRTHFCVATRPPALQSSPSQ